MSKFCCYCGKKLKTGTEKFCPFCGKVLVAERRETVKTEHVLEKDVSRKAEEHVSKTSMEDSRKKYQETLQKESMRTISNWYLVDFVKNLTKSNNIPLFIYLILNVFLIGGIVSALFSMPFWQGFLSGIVLYGISITIALSPLGEWILRIQTGCRKIKDERQINRLEPLFREVYKKAKQLNPSIPDDVRLFINHDDSINAFATGRRTVCVTEGLLDLPDDQIKATLSHEFGHLAHKDTDLILIVSIGNLIVTAIVTAVRLFISFMQLIMGIMCVFVGGKDGLVASILNAITNILINIFVIFVMWAWTKIGILMVMKSSRDNEYSADEFAFNLGYGYELCAMLDGISGPEPKGLFKNLASSHPKTRKRIERLQVLGVKYNR